MRSDDPLLKSIRLTFRNLLRRPDRVHLCIRLVVASVALVGAGAARAQVLEIDEAGAVTVYDQPTVFSADGATPIHPKSAPSAGSVTAAPHGLALSQAADAAELSPDLVEAVAWSESRLRPGLVSPAGAIGEMQLMPATARALGVNAYDTAQNYRGGAAYLSSMMRRYDGDLERALAAYNAGPGTVDRHHGAPPYPETRAYVGAIMERLSKRADAAGEPLRKGL